MKINVLSYSGPSGEASREDSRSTLETCRAGLGLLGLSWRVFEPLWAARGGPGLVSGGLLSRLGGPGPVLGLSWWPLRPSWRRLGNVLGRRGS
eukprot:2975371-Pyramimonas_sp.AAC.1